jgi:hypothetical protein
VTVSLRERIVKANTTLNLGRGDRVVRAVLPFVVAALWWSGILPMWAAVPLMVLSLMLFPTAFTGACSIYYALGWSTRPAVPPTPAD